LKFKAFLLVTSYCIQILNHLSVYLCLLTLLCKYNNSLQSKLNFIILVCIIKIAENTTTLILKKNLNYFTGWYFLSSKYEISNMRMNLHFRPLIKTKFFKSSLLFFINSLIINNSCILRCLLGQILKSHVKIFSIAYIHHFIGKSSLERANFMIKFYQMFLCIEIHQSIFEEHIYKWLV